MTGFFILDACGLAAVTFLAAVVNSVAGGGTLLTFPVLGGLLPVSADRLVVANATSTIGLWPGAITAAWAYRPERQGQPPWSLWLLGPSVVGAVLGSLLVLVLPPAVFSSAVPWLVLTAAVLFAAQPALGRLFVRSPSTLADAATPGAAKLAAACVAQFLVAIYGGYFGAGIGILMLASLGSLGLGDFHRLNGVKNVLGMLVNGAAACLFAAGSLVGTHAVSWPHAGVMAVSAAAGGWWGAHAARRLAPRLVRRIVAVLGFALAAYYFAV